MKGPFFIFCYDFHLCFVKNSFLSFHLNLTEEIDLNLISGFSIKHQDSFRLYDRQISRYFFETMKAFYHLCFVTEVIMDPKNPKNLTLINSFFLKSFRLNPIVKILYQIWSIIKTSFVSLYKNFKKFSRGHYKE